MKLGETKRDRRLLIIGASGTGKTHIIGTFCQLVPTLVVTADEEGLDTLTSMTLDPDVVLVKDWRKVWEYYNEIATAMATHKALAIDDFGRVQFMARQKIERMPRGPLEEKRKAEEIEPIIRRELLRGERRMQIQDWGSMWVAMESFLYEILALPYQIKVLTVLEDVRPDPRTGHDKIYPNLQGDIRASILARFSFVAESFIAKDGDKLYYCLSSKSHDKVETKDRYLPGGRTWVDPKAEGILAHIAGKGGVESELEKRIGAGL